MTFRKICLSMSSEGYVNPRFLVKDCGMLIRIPSCMMGLSRLMRYIWYEKHVLCNEA